MLSSLSCSSSPPSLKQLAEENPVFSSTGDYFCDVCLDSATNDCQDKATEFLTCMCEGPFSAYSQMAACTHEEGFSCTREGVEASLVEGVKTEWERDCATGVVVSGAGDIEGDGSDDED